MSKRIREKYKSTVDIVTAVYGGLDFIQSLAQTMLFDHDSGENFRWIIIDDATPEEKGSKEIVRYLRDLEELDNRITFIQNKVNKGFAGANNIGFAKCTSDYIVMLNSDTRIKNDGWLKELIQPMRSNQIIGAVGAKLLFFEDSDSETRPAGTTQHAGVAFNILNQPYHIFMGWPSNHPKVNELRVMRAVTGACLATRRNIIKRTKGLAEIYTTGNFEDVEFCVQITAAGMAVLYNPKVELYHYAGGSDNTATAQRNYNIFKLRNNHLLVWDDWRFW